MIKKLTHACIYVIDQESARDFYVNKLGFKVHTDAPMGPDANWLTVTTPHQPELEIAVLEIKAGMMFNEETAEQMRTLVRSGALSAGIFQCEDINATYEELKAKGVEFTKAPTKEFYGTEALFKDDSGNLISLGEEGSGE